VFVLAAVAILIWGFSGPDRETAERASQPTFVAYEPLVAHRGGAAGASGISGETQRGQEVFVANGCNACHTITGEKKIGPSLLGVFGTEQPLSDGTAIIADEAYVRESITRPKAKVVAGYESSMPSYADLLTDEDLDALIKYVESLGNSGG
jgi:cytochrome c oxidase subunit 2